MEDYHIEGYILRYMSHKISNITSGNNKKKKRTVRSLKELLKEFGSGSVDGEFTFQGTGNYGRGGPRQLVGGLNPATQAIQDQEQAEINQNIEDQSKTLGKFKRKVPPFKLADLEANDEVDMTGTFIEQTLVGARALPGDHFYRDLPGYPEKVNALEKHVEHVPRHQETQELEDYYNSQEERYLDHLEFLDIEDLVENLVRETLTSLNSTYWLVNPKNHLDGIPANDNTQSNVTSRGAWLASPKNFVPEDWETYQKHKYDDEEYWDFQPETKTNGDSDNQD